MNVDKKSAEGLRAINPRCESSEVRHDCSLPHCGANLIAHNLLAEPALVNEPAMPTRRIHHDPEEQASDLDTESAAAAHSRAAEHATDNATRNATDSATPAR
jgi:hypothetical protein